jgi:hypothetical protein
MRATGGDRRWASTVLDRRTQAPILGHWINDETRLSCEANPPARDKNIHPDVFAVNKIDLHSNASERSGIDADEAGRFSPKILSAISERRILDVRIAFLCKSILCHRVSVPAGKSRSC